MSVFVMGAGLYITPETTPIVYFGDYDNAKACTIALNPSDKEFVDNQNVLLDISSKPRLCSRIKLKKQDDEILDDKDAEEILKNCKGYFQINPYRTFFDPFECFIKRFENYSYYDGSCVHLNLVQWATTPKWSDVPNEIMEQHLNKDLPVLENLLEKNFEIMFLNGITVVDNVSKCLNIKLQSKEIFYKNDNSDEKLTIFYGKHKKTKIVGWNLFSPFDNINGFNNMDALCDAIKNGISLHFAPNLTT
jgi:hypothetical protein